MSRDRTKPADKRGVPPCFMDEWKVDDDHYLCPGCKATLELKREPYHVHHVVAWADGGLTEAWNLIPLCESCHAIVHYGHGARAKELHKHLHTLMQYQYGLLFLLQSQSFVDYLRKEMVGQKVRLSDFKQFDDEISSRAFNAWLQSEGWSATQEKDTSTNLTWTTYMPPGEEKP